MSKFTLGPWRLRTAVADQGMPLVIYPPDGNLRIAKICINKGEEVMEANGRLIAASPLMYKYGHDLAMLVLQSDFYQKPDVKETVDNLLAILTKVEGKEG